MIDTVYWHLGDWYCTKSEVRRLHKPYLLIDIVYHPSPLDVIFVVNSPIGQTGPAKFHHENKKGNVKR